MRVFLTGVSCVGKTTAGRELARLLGVGFLDLDQEVERFFGSSIGRLQRKFHTMHSYRCKAARALVHLLEGPASRDCVVALPPSGLMGAYLRAVKRVGGVTVVLVDDPENILRRLLRTGTGPGRITAEREFFEGLASLCVECRSQLEPLGDGEFFDLANLDLWDAEARPIGRTMRALCAFAEETLAYKARPRDPFAGERRRLARDILAALSCSADFREPGNARPSEATCHRSS